MMYTSPIVHSFVTTSYYTYLGVLIEYVVLFHGIVV